eukprot:2694208-Amphidinium_carterae.1
MDISDYIEMRKNKVDEDSARKEWEEMLRLGHEGEGEGPQRMLWITRNRKRFRDEIDYAEQGLVEGSRQVKDLADDEGQWACKHRCIF